MDFEKVEISGAEEILTPELFSSLAEEKRYARIKELAEDMPAPDLAELFYEIPDNKHALLFRLLSKEHAAETFVEMDAPDRRRLVDSFSDRELSEILAELYVDDTVDIIEEMPAVVVKRILRNTSGEDRAAINRILNYPKDSAGSVMTTEYVRFSASMTVGAALEHIRRVAIDKETIYTSYVTDRNRRLIGIITAKQLLISDPETLLSDIMDEGVISVHTHDDREEVARLLDRYGFLAMPVTDSEERLVGIITVDDAMEVIKEESEADFAVMAAITPVETPYLKTSIFSIWKSRIPWLLLLMVTATISGTILSHFEAALPAVLVIFVPMLMGTSGNSGGQSSVTVTRGISLGEVEFKDIIRVLTKEIGVGLMCGVSLAVVTFGKVMLIDGLLLGNPEVTATVAMIVSFALAVSVLVAKIIGAALPILAHKIGFDPAVMASPIITTLVDALALLLYFAIAKTVV